MAILVTICCAVRTSNRRVPKVSEHNRVSWNTTKLSWPLSLFLGCWESRRRCGTGWTTRICWSSQVLWGDSACSAFLKWPFSWKFPEWTPCNTALLGCENGSGWLDLQTTPQHDRNFFLLAKWTCLLLHVPKTRKPLETRNQNIFHLRHGSDANTSLHVGWCT